MYILHINKISLIVIIARKIDLFDTSIGVFHFQNLKMMFLNQIANVRTLGFIIFRITVPAGNLKRSHVCSIGVSTTAFLYVVPLQLGPK